MAFPELYNFIINIINSLVVRPLSTLPPPPFMIEFFIVFYFNLVSPGEIFFLVWGFFLLPWIRAHAFEIQILCLLGKFWDVLGAHVVVHVRRRQLLHLVAPVLRPLHLVLLGQLPVRLCLHLQEAPLPLILTAPWGRHQYKINSWDHQLLNQYTVYNCTVYVQCTYLYFFAYYKMFHIWYFMHKL